MSPTWKKLFVLDFEKQFALTFLRLLLLWNPLWTLLLAAIKSYPTFEGLAFIWCKVFTEATVVVVLALGLIFLYLRLEKRWLSRKERVVPRHRMGWHLFFLAVLVPPGLYMGYYVWVAGLNRLYPVGPPISPKVPLEYFGKELFWVWMVLLVAFFFKSWLDLKESVMANQLKVEELEKQRLQALLTNLKDQMNPHFLFNVLNTVAALIHADPGKAEQVVVKLSSLYQGVLRATRKTNHPLSQELEFCRNYLEIEKARFGKRLSSDIKVQKGLDATQVQVPVLLLQPFVENAVKHGLSSRASGGKIWVEAGLKEGRLQVLVEDDGVGLGKSPYAGSGTATQNCRKRLELAFGQEGQLEMLPREGGGTRVLVTLPVLAVDPSEEDKK